MTPADLAALRAIAAATAAGAAPAGWSYAPLLDGAAPAAWLVEATAQQVVALRAGVTLLAHQRGVTEHAWPRKWFEASWCFVRVEPGTLAIADARATNGGTLRGARLPLSPTTGPPWQIVPAWQPLDEGELVLAHFPRGTWCVVRAPAG